jgi:hypothetical protein
LLNKKFIMILAAILIMGISLVSAQELAPSGDATQEFVIRPDVGLGSILFGASVAEVESILGRGELLPEESRQTGFSFMNLMYRDKGLVLRFSNGQLTMALIESPEYSTANGVRVGGTVGDLIREFGSEYMINKSLMQVPDPDKEEYERVYKNIRVNIQGRTITKIWIQSTKKVKPFKQ